VWHHNQIDQKDKRVPANFDCFLLDRASSTSKKVVEGAYPNSLIQTSGPTLARPVCSNV